MLKQKNFTEISILRVEKTITLAQGLIKAMHEIYSLSRRPMVLIPAVFFKQLSSIIKYPIPFLTLVFPLFLLFHTSWIFFLNPLLQTDILKCG